VLGKRGASEPYDGSPAHSPRRKRPSAIASDRALGAQLDSQQIATTSAGYRHLLFLAHELGMPAFAIEGTGSYGAGSFATSSEPASACTSASARVARSVSGEVATVRRGPGRQHGERDDRGRNNARALDEHGLRLPPPLERASARAGSVAAAERASLVRTSLEGSIFIA
jgi:hypothetical protein